MAQKFSMQWLSEWVNLGIDHKNVAKRLDMVGVEVASIAPAGGQFAGVVVGKVLEATQHPEADRLRVCQVDIGRADMLTIVCGAANVRAGLKVALATVGGSLPGGIVLKEAKLRGIVSQGMICSLSELGLGESNNQAGILELSDDAPIGVDLQDYLQLKDDIITIELTPNRGDCLSILGLAREISAVFDAPLLIPTPEQEVPATISDVLTIELKTEAQCPRYLGRLIRHIKQDVPTPVWMKERLRRSGIRSIHPVVDITNYVMLELGQPMHAFDAGQLEGNIQVRHATPDENLELLSGETVTLDEKTQVIADQKQAQAIAGVMGGVPSSVTTSTQDIFLESAFFNPLSVAYSTQHYGISSDSAYRFERGVDFNVQKRAMERATQLILEIVGGEAGPVTEATAAEHLPSRYPIVLRLNRLEKILGLSVPPAQIEKALALLGMEVTPSSTGSEWQVLAPSYRFDIEQEIDLIEEVARIIGYETIPTRLPLAPLHANIPLPQKSALVNALVHRGYQEVITYSFGSEPLNKTFAPEATPIKLLNPISNEMGVMRNSLWPGLIQAAQYNQNRQQERIRLFEVGTCFRGDAEGGGGAPQAKIENIETKKIAGIVLGATYPEQWLNDRQDSSKPTAFFDVKGDIEVLLQLTGKAEHCVFVPGEHAALHPGQTAKILQGGQELGYFGALHPSLLTALDIKGPIYLFELNLDLLQQWVQSKAPELPKFPSIRRDIAIIVNKTVPYAKIASKIKEEGGDLLKSVTLFDLYQGEGIAADCQSMAIALIFQDVTRTLLDTEVFDRINAVLKGLQNEFSAEIRS